MDSRSVEKQKRIPSQVKQHFLLGKQIVATRHLRQPRKTRPHKCSVTPTKNPLLEFLAKRRPLRTGPIKLILFVKTKKQDYLQKCSD